MQPNPLVLDAAIKWILSNRPYGDDFSRYLVTVNDIAEILKVPEKEVVDALWSMAGPNEQFQHDDHSVSFRTRVEA